MNWIVAYTSGIAVSVISAIIMAFLFGGLNKVIASISLLAGFSIGIFIIISCSKLSSGIEKKELGLWSWVLIIIFMIFSLRSFFWLIYKKGNSLMALNPSNLGDIPMHILYIKYLANGTPFWPDNPILTGETIGYHFGIDLFNSLLILLNMDLVTSFIWVGILGSLASGFMLLVWGRAFALAGVLFSGGLAGFQFFQTFTLADYQIQLDWKNIMLTMFLTQRHLLYVIPAGLLLLCSWRQRFFNDNNNQRTSKTLLPLWIEVLLYSSMPIFQIHTFIFLSFLLLIWFFFVPNLKRIQIIKLGIFSFVPASLLVLLLTGFLKKASMFHFDFEYYISLNGFLKFWIFNFGIFWPLVAFLCFKLVTENTDKGIRYNFKLNHAMAFVYPAVVIFIIFSFVILSGWKYDNAKLLIWPYIILLSYLWEIVLLSLSKIKRYIICFLLFFSGFISIMSSLDISKSVEIAKFPDIHGVCGAVKDIPLKHRFAIYPTYNNPLFFCGRKVVLGYGGWLWPHGFYTGEKEEKLKKVMLGDKDWQKLAKELGIRYIFWGEYEHKEYSQSLRPWETNANKIASGSWGEIWDIGTFFND